MERVAFLYATFPRSTETFVRRELRAMGKLGFEPDAYSIWGGCPTWENRSINLFRKSKLCLLLFWIPYWIYCKPQAFFETLRFLWSRPCPSIQNFNETFLGFGFALVEAQNFKNNDYRLIHAVWATMPATAAFSIYKLTGIKFSMGAHAYDLFRKGGDWILELKLKHATFVRTSSVSSAKRLEQVGVPPGKIKLIQRGLECRTHRSSFSVGSDSKKLRIISVGRLVSKKGYFLMLEIARKLRDRKVSFELSIIGSGPLRRELQGEIKRKKLQSYVFLLGTKHESQVRKDFLASDVMLFTGIVDSNGDRDGIPNVVPEAMEAGCLVLSSCFAGGSEAFIDGVSGFSFDPHDSEKWVDLLEEFADSPADFLAIRKRAINHARRFFNVDKTARKLLASIQKASVHIKIR